MLTTRERLSFFFILKGVEGMGLVSKFEYPQPTEVEEEQEEQTKDEEKGGNKRNLRIFSHPTLFFMKRLKT